MEKKASKRPLAPEEEALLELGVFASASAGRGLRAGGYPPPTASQARAISRALRSGIELLLMEVATGNIVVADLTDALEGLAGVVVLDVMGPPSPLTVN